MVVVQDLIHVLATEDGLELLAVSVCLFYIQTLWFSDYILCNSAAVCSPSCMNGGTCSSPNTCTCTDGWIGESCTNGIAMFSVQPSYILCLPVASQNWMK